MDYGISHVFLILCRFLADRQFLLSLLLNIVSELLTVFYALATHLETTIHFWKFALGVVETVHAAARRFEVHRVEFFVQESVKWHLSVSQTLVQVFKDFLAHVIYWVFGLIKSEELS